MFSTTTLATSMYPLTRNIHVPDGLYNVPECNFCLFFGPGILWQPAGQRVMNIAVCLLLIMSTPGVSAPEHLLLSTPGRVSALEHPHGVHDAPTCRRLLCAIFLVTTLEMHEDQALDRVVGTRIAACMLCC